MLALIIFSIISSSLFLQAPAVAENINGNQRFESFNQVKKILEKDIVFDHRFTLYCQAPFKANKQIILPEGFQTTTSHKKRATRIEWEHVVPAEHFGRFFTEWREGSSDCFDNKGRPFKGRKCTEKTNKTFRLMQCDMYNLYPSIGAVNAERGNKNFEVLSEALPNSFGSCPMKISGNKAEPPKASRGAIARTYKYMAYTYPKFNLSKQQARVMDAWDKQYPIERWECVRAKRIEAIQGNENPFVKNPCQENKLW